MEMLKDIEKDRNNPMPSAANAVIKRVLKYVILAGLLVGLYLLSRFNYPLFHSFMDMATVFMAMGIFVLVWSRRRLLDSHYYLFVGIAFLFFAIWDFLHLLGNKGMGVFPQYGNLGPTLYIVSRYFLSISMLIAPLFIKRRIKSPVVFSVYSIGTILLLLSIFYWKNFPITFIDGIGLTSFKIISDYFICCIILVSSIHLWIRRRSLDARVFRLIMFSLALSITTGLAFTIYTDPFGVTNAVGHFFQIASFYLVYKAFVETIIDKPQNILYRSLTQHTAELESAKAALEKEIEERRRVQVDLEKTSSQHQLALDAARMGWWKFDPINNYSWWDERYKEIFGFAEFEKPNDEILASRLHPEDLPGVMAKVQAALDPADPKPYMAEYRIIMPDGSIKWIEAQGVATFEFAGGNKLATGLVGTVADITDRKRAEQEIAHLASFPELNPNPVIEADALGNLTYINPAALSRFSNLIELGFKHPFMRSVADQIERDDRQTTSVDILYADHWYEQTLTYAESSQNYRIYVKDITDRKEAEEGMNRSIIELEAANRELEAFSYSVSHDLRAPLRSMAGFGSILMEEYADELDDKGQRYLQYIQDASDLMGRLIDDLLKLSKVTRSNMSFETFNLTDVINNIFDDLKKDSPGQNATIIVAPDMQVFGDKNLLRIVFENLLGNAWKFSRNTPKPEIEVGLTNKNGKHIFFIRDNGAGFDMTYVDKLFQPFQRLHKTTEFPGTGIGLSIVKRIICRHGGEIWAESKIGEGTTFYFNLN